MEEPAQAPLAATPMDTGMVTSWSTVPAAILVSLMPTTISLVEVLHRSLN